MPALNKIPAFEMRAVRGGVPAVSVLLAMMLIGCATYRPMPLTGKAVERALTSPPAAEIRIRAKEISHPILKPIDFDDSDGLSPDEAAVLAVLANPLLRAERDRRGLADAQLLQAGILPNPQLSYGLDVPSGGRTADTGNAFGLGLDWEITSLVSRSARVAAASSNRASVDLDIAWREWQTAQAARLTVYRLAVSRRQERLAAALDRRMRENLVLVRKAVDKGYLTELNLAAAQTASNQAHAGLLSVRKELRRERLELNRAIGAPPESSIEVEGDIDIPVRLDPKASAELARDVEKRRLDLLALRRGYESEEAAVRAAILDQMPKVGLGFTHARDNSDLYTVGFGVTIRLPVFDRNQGRIALERATRQQLYDEFVSRIFEARSDIAKLVENIRSINLLIHTAEEAVPDIETLVQTYRQAVDQGQADVLSYYTAWVGLTEKRMELLSLKRQLMESRIALELCSGLYRIDSAPDCLPRKQSSTGPSRCSEVDP